MTALTNNAKRIQMNARQEYHYHSSHFGNLDTAGLCMRPTLQLREASKERVLIYYVYVKYVTLLTLQRPKSLLRNDRNNAIRTYHQRRRWAYRVNMCMLPICTFVVIKASYVRLYRHVYICSQNFLSINDHGRCKVATRPSPANKRPIVDPSADCGFGECQQTLASQAQIKHFRNGQRRIHYCSYPNGLVGKVTNSLLDARKFQILRINSSLIETILCVFNIANVTILSK